MRTQSNAMRWLVLFGACLGAALLAFVPSAAWLDLPYDSEPALLLSVYLLKQVLTVALLLIVPALWARTAHRFGAWALLPLACVAYGFGFLSTGDAIRALYTLLLIALPGAGLYGLQRLKLSNFRTVLYESVLLLVALFGYVCLPDLIENGNAYLPFRNVIVLYGRMADGLSPAFSVLDGTAAYYRTLLDLIAELKLNPEAIGIPVLTVPAMCAGLSNVLFSHLLNRRGGADLKKLPPFSEWRCERLFVYLSTGFAIVTYVLALTDVAGMATLSSVAMLVWRFPCTLAGLSAARRLSLRAKKGWIFILVCCAALLMPSFGMTVLSLLGMVASVRKQTTDRKDGTKI